MAGGPATWVVEGAGPDLAAASGRGDAVGDGTGAGADAGAGLPMTSPPRALPPAGAGGGAAVVWDSLWAHPTVTVTANPIAIAVLVIRVMLCSLAYCA